MKQRLGSVITAREPKIDPLELDAFLRQPKVQFTIDCLIDQFEKWRISQRGMQGPGAKTGLGRRAWKRVAEAEAAPQRALRSFPTRQQRIVTGLTDCCGDACRVPFARLEMGLSIGCSMS